MTAVTNAVLRKSDTCAAVIAAILSERGLTLPDRRRLYEYRLTLQEYIRVKATARHILVPDAKGTVLLRRREEKALFLLYAAEWWKREYAGGHWRWDEVLKGVLPKDAHWPGSNRSDAVEEGALFWRVPLSEEGKRFFGTLVAQGGFPSKLLGTGHGAIADLLQRGIRLASRFAWAEETLIDFFARNDERLSVHLRQPEIHRLLADLVATTLQFRSKHGLDQVADPIQCLDEREPGWRSQFSIPLDDEEALGLLSGLVRIAAETKAAPRSVAIFVERIAVAGPDGRWRLSSRVEVPRQIDAGQMADLFNVSVGEIPRYFSMDLHAGAADDRLCDGRLHLGGPMPAAILFNHALALYDNDAVAEHTVRLLSSHLDLSPPIALPGGAEMASDVPWVFAERDGRWLLQAAGSCKVPDAQVMVCLPEWSLIQPASPTASVGETGELVVGNVRRRLYTIAGAVEIAIGGDEYFLQPGQPVASPEQYIWHGIRLAYPTRPLPVFLGPPFLYRYPETGPACRVPSSNIEWFALEDGRQRTRIDPGTYAGPVEAWLMHGGKRMQRFRFVIQKKNAAIRFESGSNPSIGEIHLEGWNASGLALDRSDSVVTAQVQQLTLKIEATGLPPRDVALRLTWPGFSRGVGVRVPFPSSGGRFYSPAGDPLADGSRISVGGLAGYRVRAVSRDPRAPRSYTLEFSLNLQGAGMRRQLHRSVRIPLGADGSGEIRLIDVQSIIHGLLAQSNELDAHVRMEIAAAGRSVQQLEVARYDAVLSRFGSTFVIDNASTKSVEAGVLDKTEMDAIPLVSGQAEIRRLVPVHRPEAGRAWEVGGLRDDLGPWLLVPAAGASLQFRPTIFRPLPLTHGGSTHPEGLCPLGDVMAEGDASIRGSKIGAVVHDMALDLDHPSWALVMRHWRELKHLPLSALDSWRAIAQDPSACIAAVFRLGSKAQLIRKLQTDLGVLWELVSVRALSLGADRLRQYWEEKLKDEDGRLSKDDRETAAVKVEESLRVLVEEVPALELVVAFVRQESGLQNTVPALVRLQRDINQRRSWILRRLWKAGGESLGQQLLLRPHTADDDKPQGRVCETIAEAMSAALTDQTVRTLTENGDTLFYMERQDLRDVANLPVLCAVWAMSDADQGVWRQPEILVQLRSVRSFDPIWFQEAFLHACRVCATLGLHWRTAKRKISPPPTLVPASVQSLSTD